MLAIVRLFAIARERAGRAVIEVELADGANVGDLKAALACEVPSLALLLPTIRIAVNSDYADDNSPIPPGADLAAIPPVSGGCEPGIRR